MSPKETCDRDGYVIFRNVLDADLVAEASAHVDWLAARHPDLRPENYHHRLMRTDPFWLRLVSDPRLLDIAQQYIGPDIALFASHYICKPAGDGLPVLWHQDGAYWPLAPMDVVTLWLAVDDSDTENGCMRVVPGTQNLDLKELRRNAAVESVLGSETPEEFFDESQAVDIVLRRGDVSVHNPRIVHGSNANTSPRRRCGLTIRYIPTHTRVTDPDFGEIFLLRGEAKPGINTYAPLPRFQPGENMEFKGWEAWK
ncbi:MAG: phytanoyl-CoA dioxygenase family protein [Armatimonadota bacterium]